MRKRESFSVEQNVINIETANERIAQTRMHSSRMHTIHCSSCLLGMGCLPRRVSAQGECRPGGCTLSPVKRITDRYQKITFPQLRLQMVKINSRLKYFSNLCFLVSFGAVIARYGSTQARLRLSC